MYKLCRGNKRQLISNGNDATTFLRCLHICIQIHNYIICSCCVFVVVVICCTTLLHLYFQISFCRYVNMCCASYLTHFLNLHFFLMFDDNVQNILTHQNFFSIRSPLRDTSTWVIIHLICFAWLCSLCSCNRFLTFSALI